MHSSFKKGLKNNNTITLQLYRIVSLIIPTKQIQGDYKKISPLLIVII